MIIKTGIDLVKDERIQKQNDAFKQHVFHPSEIQTNKLPTIFALKEAIFKALEIQVSWLEVEVKYKDTNYKQQSKPTIVLSNTIKPKNLVSLDSSVSHEDGFTVAIVTLLLES